jgi:hypothetical protein
VFRESIFPDFEINVPMPERGRFKRQADQETGDSHLRTGGEKGDHLAGSA